MLMSMVAAKSSDAGASSRVRFFEVLGTELSGDIVTGAAMVWDGQ